jgi:hypothetical protein
MKHVLAFCGLSILLALGAGQFNREGLEYWLLFTFMLATTLINFKKIDVPLEELYSVLRLQESWTSRG